MNRKALFALAILAASACSRKGLADENPSPPNLPQGWIAASERPEPPKPKKLSWGSHLANHVFTFPMRRLMPGLRFELEALPMVELSPPPAFYPLPAKLPEGTPGDVVVLKKGGGSRVSVQGFEAGFIEVGSVKPTAIGRQSDGGVPDVCGKKGGSGILPIAYDAIRRVDKKGTLELVWGRGFLDAASCKVAIVWRSSARPMHVASGVVYAFRTRCAACNEGEREELHVLTPQMEERFERNLPFEHRKFALGPGRSGAFEGATSFKNPFGGSFWSMPDWQDFVDRQCKESQQTWCFKRVRLEISQGEGESLPVGFVSGDVEP